MVKVVLRVRVIIRVRVKVRGRGTGRGWVNHSPNLVGIQVRV